MVLSLSKSCKNSFGTNRNPMLVRRIIIVLVLPVPRME